mmetsp:Transcript_29871/g.63558  ORF Transcript_29871/g.63558 Transcript_29871/m.63558 type:complete len:212 (+) Transcript_29871:402-1037(+)
MSSFRPKSLRRKPWLFCHSSSEISGSSLSFTASFLHASRPLRMRSSWRAPLGKMSPSPTFALAGGAAASEAAQKRPASTSRLAGSGTACRISSSCATTASCCCWRSSLFWMILSRATGLAFSRKEGVIFRFVVSSWLEMVSNCLFSRCSSFPRSRVFSGTGMSTSRSSATTVRTEPSGVSATRPLKACTLICSRSPRASHATAGRSSSNAF